MRFLIRTYCVALAVCLALAGCDSSGVDERTTPNALDLPLVTLDEAKTTAEAPGSYNVQAYVVTRGVCVITAQCGESFVIVSNVKGALVESEGVFRAVLYTENATQFEKDGHYLFSIEITLEGTQETRTYWIVGFDRI